MYHDFTLSVFAVSAAQQLFFVLYGKIRTPNPVYGFIERIEIICLPFALLVCNGAGSLAGRLAGSLTLTAATLCSRFLQICLVNGLDVLHNKNPPYQTYLQFFTSILP